MKRTLVIMTALATTTWLCGFGCGRSEPAEAPAPAAQPAAPAPAAAAEEAAGLPEAPAGAPRRERAGIETGASPTEAPEVPRAEQPGHAPAARLIPPVATEAPALAIGESTPVARSAWAWVLQRWVPAVEAGKADGYKALLAEDFLTAPPRAEGSSDNIDRDAWPTRRTPALATGGTLTLGLAEVRADLVPPMPRVVVRVGERWERGRDCQEGTRELELVRVAGDGVDWQLTSESTLGYGPCAKRTAADFASVHEALKRALAAGDEAAARASLGAQLIVRDDGAEIARISGPDVVQRGHWVAAALARVAADADATRLAGASAVIWGGGIGFAYSSQGDGAPTLVGVLRGVAGAPAGVGEATEDGDDAGGEGDEDGPGEDPEEAPTEPAP